MANLILFDDLVRDQLLPLTYTRPVCELRVGILTIREKWERALGASASHITQDYLSEKFPISFGQRNLIINGSVFPSEDLLTAIENLDREEALLIDGDLIAASIELENFQQLIRDDQIDELVGHSLESHIVKSISHLWDLFLMNDQYIREDYTILTKGRKSAAIGKQNVVYGQENIFIEDGCDIKGAFLNAENGPIYVGKGVTIMEGAVIRGPVAILNYSKIKANAAIYGPTTIGPYCKVGGEVKRVIMQGHTNKAHRGYLGDSVVGEWCNFGAGSTNSNLKNTYGKVKLWNYPEGMLIDTDQQYCGLFMGDHSKCAINTSFNTGAIIGVCSNVIGHGFTPKFIPSFTWGGPANIENYDLDKAIAVARMVHQKRDKSFNEQDELIFKQIFKDSERYRK